MEFDRAIAARRSLPGRAAIALVLLASLLGGCAQIRAFHTGDSRVAKTSAGVLAPRSVGGARCDETGSYDVLIVGAGLAGLAAGRELTHLGRSVLILEATDRVGGRGFVGKVRVGSRWAARVPIDYGGAWIHGVPTNPLTALVDEMGFGRTRTEFERPFYNDGVRASKPELKQFNDAYGAYEESLAAGAEQIKHEMDVAEEVCGGGERIVAGDLETEGLCARIDISVADEEASARLCEQAHQLAAGTLEPDRFCADAHAAIRLTSDVAADYVSREDRFRDFVPLVLASAGPLETAAELDASSAVGAEGFASGEDDLVDKGLGTFVQAFGDGLPICLNAPVTHIAYDEVGVALDAGGRRYAGTDVVVTVPVGVLQAEMIHFEPALPAWKRKAIDELRMGHMQKVIIPFSKDIFGDEVPNSWVAVEDVVGPAEKALAARAGLDIQEQDRRVMAFVFKPLDANIAIGFYGGEWAELFENQCAGLEHTSGLRSASGCDDMAINVAVRALKRMFGAEVVAGAIQSDEIHVTRWSLEPYTLGAYSVPLPGSWHQREVLGRPVAAGAEKNSPLRVFFAGEACSRAIFNGSYPGALETGIEAARDINRELLTAGSGD